MGKRQGAVEVMGVRMVRGAGAERFSELHGCRTFVTGHTGFKGSWLLVWLKRLNCEVTGYALEPDPTGLFARARLDKLVDKSHVGDIADPISVTRALHEAEPELVFHMAAQALVRKAYNDPVMTWATNTMGTVNVLEAVRTCPSVRAVVVVTSDKCYENREWRWGYREIDALGGGEPYGASKASAELVVQSYRKSYFHAAGPLVASARAGNVIGGGDWSEDRLIPDAARAVEAGRPLVVRCPNATRPWQHVLDCLAGYLTLATKLLSGDRRHAGAYNFGPSAADNITVGELLTKLGKSWPELDWRVGAEANPASVAQEATYLYLDSNLARDTLGWRPTWPLRTALAATAEWYRTALLDPTQTAQITSRQLSRFCTALNSAAHRNGGPDELLRASGAAPEHAARGRTSVSAQDTLLGDYASFSADE